MSDIDVNTTTIKPETTAAPPTDKNESTLSFSAKQKWLMMFSLVFAGEIIFSLPFHVARFFRPTVLDVFQLSHAQLGDIFAIYGVTAMLAYFPGGALADKFSARALLITSLFLTAMGGLVFMTVPNAFVLAVLYGYWGITTIFLFWAALLKVTRLWGGDDDQGKAFGLLDGGRGLIAAGLASLMVLFFSSLLPDDLAAISAEQRIYALRSVIALYSAATLLGVVFVWLWVPKMQIKRLHSTRQSMQGIKEIISKPRIWLQAIIVVMAYTAYKSLDFYASYAVEVLGMNEVSAAQLVSNAAYLRVFSAIAAGYFADKFSAGKVIIALFISLLATYLSLALLGEQISLHTHSGIFVLGSNILVSFAAVYALRGVYFALLQDVGVKKAYTGTAIGVVSVIGYTPDVFLGSVAGRVLDANPGATGYYHFFLMLCGVAIVGIVVSAVLLYFNQKQSTASEKVSC
ncbi:MFS transporter [Flocculibacter collagenilyticus]|uniref:MFS transporter n=1 Tax=Flocculibacter collagenilyticus TaxID=2744479 RepID=UPI0018F5B917|nr:MFS transporter [Flocculibacter collagenilyticus]